MTTFQESSREAARLFLQTVVIVDNQAGYFSPPEPVPDEDELVAPDDLDTTGEDTEAATTSAASDAPLNAMAVSEAFASQGLVCAILKPTPENGLTDAAVRASERADVLVLDWEMEDSGQLATSIASSLLVKDELAGGRLRLIAIYTGRSPLADVRASFQQHYKALQAKCSASEQPQGPKVNILKDELIIEAGSSRIIFLSKNSANSLPFAEQKLAVSDVDLPERLLIEFARFAGGLLPNATLASIAEIRTRTHRMLARFNKSLDGPVLTNRALTEHKEESEEIASNLILAELEGQVPLSHIAHRFMGAEGVREYLKHQISEGTKPAFMKNSDGTSLEPLSLDQVCSIIEKGLSGFDEAELASQAASVGLDQKVYRGELAKSFHKRLYAILGDVKSGRSAHERFAIVSTMKRDITGIGPWTDDNRPSLKLGSILSLDGLYWVCLTPLCDCVRLSSGKAALLFTQLHKDNSTFELVVPKDSTGATVAKLRTKPKEMQLITMNFANVEKGIVRAKVKGEQATFAAWPLNATANDAKDYFWVGELKPMQAQRLIQNFASNMARVGLDENEWHRLQS